jgi:diguanylate cyclase
MSSKTCRYGDDMNAAQKNKDAVLRQIDRLELPPTPVHFTLLYELVTKTDPDFAKELQQLIENHQYTDESVRPLYRSLLKRILNQHLPTQDVSALINEVLTHLETWSKESDIHQKVLDQNIECLKSCDSKEEVLTCIEQNILPPISRIKTETKQLHKQINDSASVIKRLKQELEEATSLAKTDSLTGIPNRRGFDELVTQRIDEAKTKSQTFAMLLLDLDYFKKINDHYGHLVGDSVLRYIARTLQAETKGQDAIARLGGEEFVILLSDINYDNAMKFAEKIRLLISKKSLRVKDHDQALSFTTSVGVAVYQMGETAEHLFERADRALYLAKQSGRNLTRGEHHL